MSVSAIVVSYRTGPVLWDCLAALAAAAEITEIVVVDNGNPPEAEAKLDAFILAAPKLKVLRGQGNIGFGAASNLGARAARGQTLLFVNPDVVIGSGAVAVMLEALDRAFSPALVGGDLRNPSGAPERGARRERLTLWRAFTSFTGLSRFERFAPALRDINRERDPAPQRPTPYGAVSGAFMAMRRSEFAALRGFDEGYFLHVEDFDLCRRVEEAGGQVLFAPGALAKHARSSSDARPAEIERHKARGFARYFQKFARGPFERALAWLVGAALFVILPLRARR